MILQDKYAMDIEENIWIAKRLLVDLVYTSADLEGIVVTFAQTQDILNNVTDRAIRTGLWLMRCQVFKDGNKRIGSFAINKILIENGRGIFKVPVELDGTFKQMLVSYYESNNADELASWICDNCLDGVNKIQVKDDIENSLDESIYVQK